MDSPVPDITWLLPDDEQPRGVEIIYDLPRDLQEIQVNIAAPLIGGPYDGDPPIVNSNPLPNIIVMVQQVSINYRRYDVSAYWGPEKPHLKAIDPAAYIATRFTRRHIYRLVKHGIACAYAYMGWWSP